MVQYYINGITVKFDVSAVSRMLDSYSLIQQCDVLRITIPRFCYHEHLSIAGNCRMCVVEIGGVSKPSLACSTEVVSEMEVYTNSILVKQARETMLEFLLLNHPLDCPICDQGGECDLQDQTGAYGSDIGRFLEYKRGVSIQLASFGPLIKVTMTRCIHCTRCVRFFDEIVGVSLLGTTGRGSATLLSTYALREAIIYSHASGVRARGRAALPVYDEIIGNVADICPVGALTAKPSAYTMRVWEVVSTESIDILDSLCSNIRIDTYGAHIVRILPRINDLLNNEWITDKIRHCGAGLSHGRIVSPGIVDTISGAQYLCSWEIAYEAVANGFASVYTQCHGNMFQFIGHAGALLDAYSLFVFRLLCASIGISSVNRHAYTDVDMRLTYIFADKLTSVFNDCDVLLLLGVHMKKESSILHIRITNRVFESAGLLRIGYIGTFTFPTYKVTHLGLSSVTLLELLHGRAAYCAHISTTNAACIIGSSATTEFTMVSLLHAHFAYANYLCLLSGDVNTYELCALPSYNIRSLYAHANETPGAFRLLVGADERDYVTTHLNVLYAYFSVYIGHTMAANVHSVVLPSSAYTEHSGSYMNCIGMVQRTTQAVYGSAHTRVVSSDAASTEAYPLLDTPNVLCSLSRYLASRLPYVETNWLTHDLLFLYRYYMPHKFNYISECTICAMLLRAYRNTYSMRKQVYIVVVRSTFDVDVITRTNALLNAVVTADGEADVAAEYAQFYELLLTNYEEYS